MMKRAAGLAFPAIVSNITVPLLGLCDTAISGHLGDTKFLAAIAAGTMMMNVIFFLFGFLRMGATGMTAGAYGAGDRKLSAEIFTSSLILGLTIGTVTILLSSPLLSILSTIIHAGPEVTVLAGKYFKICIIGAPAQLGIMAMNGWMVGMQSTTRPMIVSIVTNIINVALSLIAVFVMRQGFVGIALGTAIANWCGFTLALVLSKNCFGREKLFQPLRQAMRGSELKKFFKVNSDLFLRSFCIMAVTMGVTSIGARLGEDTLAVNVVINQFFIFFSYFMDGFAYAAEALCGKSRGSNNKEELRLSVRALVIWTTIMAVSFSIIYSYASGGIVGLLTDATGVRAAADGLRPWIILLPVISAAAFIYDGFYIGMIATRRMLISTFAAMAIFFIISFLHFRSGEFEISLPTNETLWTAFLCYLATRGVLLALQWPMVVRSTFKS